MKMERSCACILSADVLLGFMVDEGHGGAGLPKTNNYVIRAVIEKRNFRQDPKVFGKPTMVPDMTSNLQSLWPIWRLKCA